MRRAYWVLAAGSLWLLAGGPARAGFTYAFDQSNYTVAAGGSIDVQVYLVETGTSLLSSNGLTSAGMRVLFGGPLTSPAVVASLSDIHTNAAFDGIWLPDLGSPLGGAGLQENVDILSPPVQASAGSPDRILLGTFHFTAVADGVAQLRVTDYDPTTSDTILAPDPGTPLDSLIQDGSATITVGEGVTATPAPGGLALLGTGALTLAGYFWRRRA